LAATYAALILADEGVEITVSFALSLCEMSTDKLQGEKIHALTSAAKVELEPIWASLLAKALDGKDVKALLTNVGGGGAPAAAGPAAAAGGATEAAAEEKPADAKAEEKEESDDDMVCYNFGTWSKLLTDSFFRVSVSSTKRFVRLAFRFCCTTNVVGNAIR
jgi:large subunit ribosomal protein LP1